MCSSRNFSLFNTGACCLFRLLMGLISGINDDDEEEEVKSTNDRCSEAAVLRLFYSLRLTSSTRPIILPFDRYEAFHSSPKAASSQSTHPIPFPCSHASTKKPNDQRSPQHHTQKYSEYSPAHPTNSNSSHSHPLYQPFYSRLRSTAQH